MKKLLLAFLIPASAFGWSLAPKAVTETTGYVNEVNRSRAAATAPAASFNSFYLQYLKSATSADLTFTTAETYSFGGWYYLNDYSAYYMLLNLSNQRKLYVDTNGNVIFETNGTGASRSMSTAGAWRFVVAVHTTNLSYVYVDGVSSSAVATDTSFSASPIRLGIDTNDTGSPLNGRAQNNFFYKRALTAAEITQLYNAGAGIRYDQIPASLKTGLISWWPLSEQTGPRQDVHGTNTLLASDTHSPKNLLVWSEEFDNASWNKYSCAIAANTQVAPDGTTTADTISGNTAQINNGVYMGSITNAGGNYTLSVYAKAGTSSTLAIELRNGTTTPTATFNLSNGTYTAISGTGSMAAIGNGWYRCSNTISVVSPTLVQISVSTANAGEYIYIWGAQLEAGTAPTTYAYTRTPANLGLLRLAPKAAAGITPGINRIVDRDVQRLVNFSSGIDRLVGWNNMISFPMRATTNTGSGTTVQGLGGLGRYTGTMNSVLQWSQEGTVSNWGTSAVMTTISPVINEALYPFFVFDAHNWWVTPYDPPWGRSIEITVTATGTLQIAMQAGNYGTVYYLPISSTTYQTLALGSTYPPNVWHTMTGTVEGGVMAQYVDGGFRNSATRTTPFTTGVWQAANLQHCTLGTQAIGLFSVVGCDAPTMNALYKLTLGSDLALP